MPATFRQVSNNSGFDADATPRPWLMVPLNGSDYVKLEWSTNLSLQMRDPGIAGFQTFPVAGETRVQVNGLRSGNTTLEVRAQGIQVPVAALDIAVFERKPLGISFHFVNDRAGHVTNRMESEQVFVTSRPGSPMTVYVRPQGSAAMMRCVNECMKDLNDIYTPQTNLTFELRHFGQTVIDGDLTDQVHASIGLLNKLRMLKDHSARINVFFVWDFVVQGLPGATGRALRPLPEGICIVDDQANLIGVTVAHEVGHILLHGLAFHHFENALDNRMLMFQRTSPFTRKIPKAQAIHMHQRA